MQKKILNVPLNWDRVRIVTWVTFFKNCLQNFDPSKNMVAIGGRGRPFALYGHEENLETSSPKQLVRIWNNFRRLFWSD